MAVTKNSLPIYLAPVGPPTTPQALQSELERLQVVLRAYQAALVQLQGTA